MQICHSTFDTTHSHHSNGRVPQTSALRSFGGSYQMTRWAPRPEAFFGRGASRCFSREQMRFRYLVAGHKFADFVRSLQVLAADLDQ